MKIKTGIDIIEVERIKKAIISSGDRFIKRVYTENEILYCNKKNATCYEHFAARFAVKEAVIKALSDLLKSKYELSWKDIEIINKKDNKPIVVLHKKIKNIVNIDISISHIKEYAVGNVVVLIDE